MKRACGDCQLCCRLLPMKDNEPWRKGPAIDKPANVRCPHQKHNVGCAIYAKRPWACQVWTCRWLTNQDTADQSRPDRAHLVVDVMPDYITVRQEGEEDRKLQVVQVWCDPRYPDAHRDPAFRAYLARRGEEGIAALLRFGPNKSITIFPPALSADGQFHEIGSNTKGEERTTEEIMEFLSGAKMEIEL